MASSCGNSSSYTATPPQPYSSSVGDARNSSGDHIDQRKRRRMESNRESARRSRLRKHKHVNDLSTQILHQTKENGQILSGIDAVTQHLVAVEAENSILRAQVTELSQRLQSLDGILNFICLTNFNGHGIDDGGNGRFGLDGMMMNQVDMGYVQQQPIMAAGAGDVFGC